MINPLDYIQPSINIWTAVILFGVVQGLILVAYLYKVKGLGYQYLSLLIITFVVAEIEAFLYYTGYIVHTIHWLYVSIPFILLSGPALLAYIKRLSGESISRYFWLKHTWLIILCTLYTGLFYAQPVQKKLYNYLNGLPGTEDLSKPYQYFNVDPLEINGWIFVEGMALYLLIYSFISLRKSLHIKSKVLRPWSLLITLIVIIMGLLMLLAEGGQVERIFLYEPILPGFMTRVHASFALYGLAIYALFNPTVINIKPKYGNSTLTDKLRVAKTKKILQVFENEKEHLSQDYSLAVLSQLTSISEHHISEVINLELGLTFYQLTNKYRIREAKKILSQKETLNWSMEQLAYHLGYKSKSTFYNAFRKAAGVTPLQYRQAR